MCHVLHTRQDCRIAGWQVVLIAVVLILGVSMTAPAQECSITIDNIVGAWHTNGTYRLVADKEQTITMRYIVTCEDSTWYCGFNISNAYLVFSPDSADWGYAQAWVDTDVWGHPDGTDHFRFVTQFFNHFNKTAGTGAWGPVQSIAGGNTSGNDSVAVLFAASIAYCRYGLRAGSDLVPLGLKIKPTSGSVGKHVCIDTARAVPGGPWMWPSIEISHPSIIPDWYPEPQCFEIVGCCFGESMGNIDLSSDGLVTMADLTVLIDHLFITLTPLVCPIAANLDQSSDGLVTMDDLTVLIDHLYITLASLPACP